MKVDMKAGLCGWDGRALMEQTDEGKRIPLTLRSVCGNALCTPFADEKIGGEEKVRRFTLAQRIFREDTPDLTPEELVLCRKLIERAYGTNVCAPAWELLQTPAS